MWNFILEWIHQILLERSLRIHLGHHIPACHTHTKAHCSKTVRTIFLKLSDIVPNTITDTSLH